ncbi:MAG: mechanosensitive ion channel domain-containing protein [Dehalococcoidales bacterium]
MWDWFTINSIWFLTGTSVLFIFVVIYRNRLRDRLLKLKSDQKEFKGNKAFLRILLFLIYIFAAVILLSTVAIILSEDEIFASVNFASIQEWLLSHGIIILVYIIVAYFLYRATKALVPKMVTGYVKNAGRGKHSKSWFERRAKTLTVLVKWIVVIVIGTATFFLILEEIGMDITPLLASAGIVGVALALGAQTIIKDFLAGLFILLEDQYNKGDVIKIAEISGEVVEVNLRRTVLRDLDGIVHTIPNSAITTASNYTRDLSRVNVDIPVTYGEDLDKVFTVINRIGKEMAVDPRLAKLIKTPPQVLRVSNFADSAIQIRILGDVQPGMQWEVTGELRKRIKNAFDKEGIEMPWPHIKVFQGKEKKQNVILCKNCSFANLETAKYCGECGENL